MIISLVSFIIFLSCIIVITSYSPITSVVYLIATFVITAIYLSSQNIVYIALTYIIVYVGAVITLFLFVVMIINLQTELTTTPFTQTVPLTIVIVVLYTILMINSHFHAASPGTEQVSGMFQSLTQFISPDFLDTTSLRNNMTSFTGNAAVSVVNDWNQIQSIGFELYTHQAMWLVLVSIVLMISIIGPIVICRPTKKPALFPFIVSFLFLPLDLFSSMVAVLLVSFLLASRTQLLNIYPLGSPFLVQACLMSVAWRVLQLRFTLWHFLFLVLKFFCFFISVSM